VPVSAAWSRLDGVLAVTMSRALTLNEGVPCAGFTIRDDGTLYRSAVGAAADTDLYGSGCTSDGFAPAGSTCSYDGSEPTLTDDLGRAVPAWSDFPWSPA
jgi:hypothetical protein